MNIREIDNLEFMDCVHREIYEYKCGQKLSFTLHIKSIVTSFFRTIRIMLNKN